MRFLTFDLGTTLYKVALFDDRGNLLGVERAIPPIQHNFYHHAELDADALMSVLRRAALGLRAKTGGDWSDVAAVSFATQANTFTFLDDSGNATIPFILWSDQRALYLEKELAAVRSPLPRFGPLLALAKVLWLRRHKPGLLHNAKRFCLL